MNDVENKPYCYFHPKEAVVGICAHCLKERLLILASKQSHHRHLLPLTKENKIMSFRVVKRKALIVIPKVFAFGSFLHFLESHPQQNKDHSDDEESIASLEDSFISIKFEDGEQASWNNKKGNKNQEVRTMVEHPSKRSRVLLMRWGEHIGKLLRFGGWKKANKESPRCHFGGKVEGAKGGRRGGGNWIKNLMNYKERTTTSK
ncbi:hypothetical protein Cni_G03321 [Canna indica]|uniref:Uncharacterized protein n=1 Tax=Canna indica TaxID=4628 RepID=A0AAQ3JTP6_9LILI|nr:hypothetical protein Cni_G03321 [Canna indica]